eukprot:14450446-Alexandrium_andersonii.AAC.1
MSASLVGSEMCIRDRHCNPTHSEGARDDVTQGAVNAPRRSGPASGAKGCLLYTSDAADDM